MYAKMTRIAAAITAALVLCGTARSDEPAPLPKVGALTRGANVGPALSGLAQNVNPVGTPFNRGIGQIVSTWTHEGIHGTELAARIHQLQGKTFPGGALDDQAFRPQQFRRFANRENEVGDGRESAEKVGSLAQKHDKGLPTDFRAKDLDERVFPARHKFPFGRGGGRRR